MASQNILAYVAIDFGTTFSGFAFSLNDGKKNIYMNKNWGSEVNCSSYKTPTCVLVDANGKFKSFGYTAENDFCSHPGEGYLMFRNFKMELMGKSLTTESRIKSTSGQTMLAVEIFAMALKFLKEKFFEEVKNVKVQTLDVSDIQWIITVPAIWSDKAKHFMREASFKAGLIIDINSTQLLIALEPEAASIYCRTLPIDDFKIAKEKELQFKIGEKYLIIDAGGGTVDITFHEIISKESVHEILPASGGPWGGMNINREFEKILESVFGSDFINKYKTSEEKDWLQIILAFERAKYGQKEGKDGGSCNITISWNFAKSYMKFNKGEDVEETIQNKKVPGVSFKNGCITFDANCVNRMFEATIKNIIHHLKDINSQLRGKHQLSYVLLVGGFGQSDFLQKAVMELYEGRCPVLVPNDAQLAVVKGAVIFGQNPSVIEQRIAKYTYGFDVMKPFIHGVHDERYMDNFGGVRYCSGLFKVILRKNEPIKKDFVIEHEVATHYIGKTEIDFYYSENVNPTYYNEPGCHKLSTLAVHHSNSAYESNIIIITVRFGGTEMKIEAKGKFDDRSYHLTVKYR